MEEKTLTREEKDALYLNNHERSSYQVELWAKCNQGCVFCYLGKYKGIVSEEKQLLSLENLNKALDTMDFTKYNNISLIGGEFFQGEFASEKVKEKFIETCLRIGELYKEHKIGSMWMTCTLTRAHQDGLYELLNEFEDNEMFIPDPEYGSSGLWICTSLDAVGRFKNKTQQQIWCDHMQNLTVHYPWVKKNITTILTAPFIKEVLDGNFVYKDMCKKYNATFFFKQSGIPSEIIDPSECWDEETKRKIASGELRGDTMYNDVPGLFFKHQLTAKQKINKMFGFDMFPSRELFIKFLQFAFHTDKEFFERICNVNFRADELHRNFKPDMVDFVNPRAKGSLNDDPTSDDYKILPCGHNYVYAAYSDDGAEFKCVLCDKYAVAESESADEN